MQCKIFTKSLKSSNSCTGTLQIKQSLQTLIEFIHVPDSPSTSVIQKGTHFGKRSLSFSLSFSLSLSLSLSLLPSSQDAHLRHSLFFTNYSKPGALRTIVFYFLATLVANPQYDMGFSHRFGLREVA